MASPRSLEALVNQQVRRWELAAGSGASTQVAPSIALSRLPGAAAAELGDEVAVALGFGFFDIEIMDLIARETGTQRELVAGLDEHVRSTIERFVSLGARGRTYNESSYHEQLVRALATLGERGLAVILGRGSAFVLRPERTLRVLVVAPWEERLERLAKRRDLSRAEAARELEHEEAERLAFNRYHFHVNPDDATLYDVVVNTGTLSVGLATELVVAAARRRFGIRG